MPSFVFFCFALSLLTACSSADPDSSALANAATTENSLKKTVRLDTANGDTVGPNGSENPGQDGQEAGILALSVVTDSAAAQRVPNEYGRIPVVEYHLVDSADGTYKVSRERFRAELDTLYARGYRPISLAEMLDKKIDLPRGMSPVLFIFDDASPSQFRYIERNGQLVVDPTSALGVWMDFAADKPDWRSRGLFCLLSGAEAGRSFFGNKGIEGQKSEWRFPKLQQLDSMGFELCNHTLWHARLDKYDNAFVQEQIARGELAIDSAIPGYKVRGFALPLGMWPKTRELAWAGAWTDPKSKRELRYSYDAVFEVAGGPTRSPYDPKFNPRSIARIPLGKGMPLFPTLRQLEKEGAGGRYVSDGDPGTVAGTAPSP